MPVTTGSRRGAICVLLRLVNSTTLSTRTELLRRVDLFSELSPQELEVLARVALPRTYGAGAMIFREGDRGDTCYVIEVGKARVATHHSDGRQITLANLKAGDVFGELAMFHDEVRSAGVEARTDVKALAFFANDIKRLLLRHPEVSIKMIAALVRRLHAANERLSVQSFQTVAGRVSTALRQMAMETTVVGSGPVVINATQTDVAEFAGTSRESVSRFLSDLQRDGVVVPGRSRITIVDLNALDRYIY